MTEISKYNYYSLNSCSISPFDFLDEFSKTLMQMKEYDQVKEFLFYNFGKFEEKAKFSFPKLNKEVYLKITDKRIEVVILKDKKISYTQYWQLVQHIEENNNRITHC